MEKASSDMTYHKKRIVLADDEAFILAAYKEGLERAGYEVFTAADGETAFEAISVHHPDIVLLDLIMPKMTGFEVLKALMSNPKLATIPVIVLSNLSQQTDGVEVRELGAKDFLIKSDYSLEQIVKKVEGMVGISSSDQLS